MALRTNTFPQRAFSPPDLLILGLLATVIYTVVSLGTEWQTAYRPTTQIELSLSALPKYVLLSAMRGLLSYVLSITFALVMGYAAAKSQVAERILVPTLDILQSVPVLAFLPSLVLGLIALFPNTNFGLELACILAIFTSQAWNLVFAFYSSLKSIPVDLTEASTIVGMSRWERLKRVELPFAAIPLAWNSLFSIAGGWFFLTVCEAFTLGDREFRLPGIGSYMAVAIAEGDHQAMAYGIAAMTILILLMDFVLWRPLMSWVQRYRLDEGSAGIQDEPLMNLMVRGSRILRGMRLFYRRLRQLVSAPARATPSSAPLRRAQALQQQTVARVRRFWRSPRTIRALEWALVAGTVGFTSYFLLKLGRVFSTLNSTEWVVLGRNTLWTFLRVAFSTLLGTLWTVPLGIWVATSPSRIRIAQPIIQVIASFPAPMLFPLLLMLLFKMGMSFNIAAMFLMLFGTQWYILFNVMSGALGLSRELTDAMALMETTTWSRWRDLYLPTIYPALVTGWVTAAGGAWNASIVAEYMVYEGQTYAAGGLGAMISVGASRQDFRMLATSVTAMVVVVILLNRTLWARLYALAQTRYRMDL